MDAEIDPRIHDLTGRRITTLANAVYLRIVVPLGSWFGDRTLGSRLHELKREKDVARVAILAKQYTEQALRPLLDDGRAKSVDVAAERRSDGRLWLTVELLDAGDRRQTFEHLVSVI